MNKEKLKTLKDLNEDWEEKLRAEAVKCLFHGIDNYKTPEEVSSRIIQNFVDFFGWTEKELE